MSKDNFTTLLGPGTEYQGKLTFKGQVRIEGRFAGEIDSDGKLVLGRNAEVDAVIRVSELEVQGTLRGDVLVEKRTVLYRTAKLFASLTTPLLTMEEGALLQGALQMGTEDIRNKCEKRQKSLQQQEKCALPMPDSTVAQ